MRVSIHSRPQNLALKGEDGACGRLSIPPKEPRALARVGSIVLLISVSVLFFCSGCFLAEKIKSKDPYLWDFGKVKQAAVLKHTFQLKNTGKDTLIINNVRPSCGCTGTLVSSREIPPGGSSEIEVTFNTKGYSGEAKQYVYVHTDSPITPIIRLTVKAKIIKEGWR